MIQHNKNLLAVVSVLVFIILGLIIYFSFGNSAPKELKDVTFSPKWVNQAQFAGVFVAKDKGFYEKEGINLILEEFESGDSVMNDIKTGASDLGLMNANEFLIFNSRGENLKAVAAFYQISPYVVASLRARDIDSPSDLKDKRLGIKGGSGAEAKTIFDLLLSSAGISYDDVEFINLPLGPSEKDDLIEEKTDVVGFYRTRLYQFDKEGVQYNVIYPEKYGSALYNDVLVVSNDYLKNNEELVKGFIKATIRGWEYAYKNKDEAVSITLRYVSNDSYKDIDYEKFILRESEKLMIPDGDIKKLGQMNVENWQKFYDSLQKRGQLDSDFDIRNIFTNSLLPN